MKGQIFIDSTNLEIDNHYAFTVNLQEKIHVSNSIKLTQAVIPFDSYTINEDNYLFSFKTYDFALPTGNYTITSLLAQIKSQVVVYASSFNIQVNNLKGSIVMSDSANFEFKMNKELASMLGFKKLFYSGSPSYMGEQTPVLYNPQVVLIDVHEIPDNTSAQANRYDTSFSFLITNSSNPGQNIQYNNTGDENEICMTGCLRSFTIKLYKNNGSLFKIRSPIQLSFSYE